MGAQQKKYRERKNQSFFLKVCSDVFFPYFCTPKKAGHASDTLLSG